MCCLFLPSFRRRKFTCDYSNFLFLFFFWRDSSAISHSIACSSFWWRVQYILCTDMKQFVNKTEILLHSMWMKRKKLQFFWLLSQYVHSLSFPWPKRMMEQRSRKTIRLLFWEILGDIDSVDRFSRQSEPNMLSNVNGSHSCSSCDPFFICAKQQQLSKTKIRNLSLAWNESNAYPDQNREEKNYPENNKKLPVRISQAPPENMHIYVKKNNF